MKLMNLRTVLKAQFAINEEVIDSMIAYIWSQSENFKLGRTEFSKGISANAESYRTKSESKFEYHRKMVDVQILIRGHEQILFGDTTALKEVIPYDPAKDIAFAEGEETDKVELYAGEFCVVLPGRPHMPCMTVGQPCDVCKVVFKIHKKYLAEVPRPLCK